jgi:cytochrome c oxidase subunit III
MEANGAHLDEQIPARPLNLEQVRIGNQRRYGMWWFLASLGMLFAATIVGYLAVRLGKAEWAQEDLPPLPATLWISTGVLVLLSSTLEWGRRRAAAGYSALPMIRLAGFWALAFLGAQTWSWFLVLENELSTDAGNLYAFAFFMLTVLHALHVVGGIVSLAWVEHRARQGAYASGKTLGLHEAVIYWHFLFVTWIVLYAVLAIAN